VHKWPSVVMIVAVWDDDAGVFVATSDDVPGLVAEAETTEALFEKLSILIPELLELNQPDGPEGADIQMCVQAEFTKVLQLAR